MLSLTSPVRTPYHDLPAWSKLLALCALTVALFQIRSPVILGGAALIVLALYAAGGMLVLRTGLRRLRPLAIFVVAILIWHGATDDLAAGVAICLRLLAVVGFANLVTMTTSLEALVEIATALVVPLRRFGLRPALIGFAIALVIRFIPVLIDRAGRMTEAWRARAVRRPDWRLLTPVLLSVLDDADHVAEALRARGGLVDEN